tara:strand:+ start:5546 stop:5746 length:201 start_codon:yes stop_codon:yes gene_type:complete
MSNNTAKTPDYIAYEVSDGSDNNFWNKVGAAWSHKDGNGINIQLTAIPLSGKITLRVPKSKDDDKQ